MPAALVDAPPASFPRAAASRTPVLSHHPRPHANTLLLVVQWWTVQRSDSTMIITGVQSSDRESLSRPERPGLGGSRSPRQRLSLSGRLRPHARALRGPEPEPAAAPAAGPGQAGGSCRIKKKKTILWGPP